MEVTIGKEGLTKTWQNEFPDIVECHECRKLARIGFVAHEGIAETLPNQPTVKNVSSLHPNESKGNYWLHDCCAVAVYFCQNCLKPTALHNQR